MNRQSPQSPDGRLDAAERALSALLPRLHGRTEPGPELDAAILAAARTAASPAAGGARPPHRRSWIAPTALAASLVLAVGLAWQLRPLPSLPAPAASDADAAAPAEEQAMQAILPPAPAQEALAQSKPMAVPAPVDAAAPAPASSARVEAKRQATVPAPPAPPPPPPTAAPVVMDTPRAIDVTPATQAAESDRAPAPTPAKAMQAGAAGRERAPAANSAAPVRDEAARAADASTLGTVGIVEAEEPDADVPPATADAPEVRDAWLRRIGELRQEGKVEDARASLAEFRRRYPDAVVPPELRTLED